MAETRKRPRTNVRPPSEIPTVNDIQKANRIKVVGKNPRQIAYIQAIRRETLTFAIGPAGTGKTYIPTLIGLDMLLRGQVERFIIVRPAVAVDGEEHGFLPGDIGRKLAPWARPVTDIMTQALGAAQADALIASKKVEAMPFTYMRGLTMGKAFILLDEAQNTTPGQMQAFTTRLGEDIKVVICGDTTQSDLQRSNNGLAAVVNLVRENGITAGLAEFLEEDVERSALAQQFVRAWARTA